jgi:hypothetical protein
MEYQQSVTNQKTKASNKAAARASHSIIQSIIDFPKKKKKQVQKFFNQVLQSNTSRE